jgi:hypothetical protein
MNGGSKTFFAGQQGSVGCSDECVYDTVCFWCYRRASRRFKVTASRSARATEERSIIEIQVSFHWQVSEFVVDDWKIAEC